MAQRNKIQAIQALKDEDDKININNNTSGIISATLKCELCPLYPNESDLRRHAEGAHETAKKTCPICQQVVACLKLHLKTHPENTQSICTICGKTFLHESDLKKHLKFHSKEAKLTCYICNRVFSRKGVFEQHMNRHTGVKPYECENCDKKFSVLTSLVRHRKYFHPSGKEIRKIFKCNYCEKVYKHSWTLKVHLTSHTGERELFTCYICNKTFQLKNKLSVHMNLHTDNKRFKCKFCGTLFSRLYGLTKHYQTVFCHKDSTATAIRLKCNICDKSFSGPFQLKRHLICHNENREKYTCAICGKEFVRKDLLKNHLDIHTGKSKWWCSICKNNFSSKLYLRQHLNIHTGEKPFKCEYCDATFSLLSSFTTHRESHNGPVTCPKCNGSFKSKKALMKHMRIHSERKKYTCNICGKSYNRNPQLKIHLAIHTDRQKFKCTICGKDLSTAEALKQHMNLHTGNKPFKCHCGKAFFQRSGLRKHELTHTDSMTCKICGKSYQSRSSLVYHFRKFHSNGTFRCFICLEKFIDEVKLKMHLTIHSLHKRKRTLVKSETPIKQLQIRLTRLNFNYL